MTSPRFAIRASGPYVAGFSIAYVDVRVSGRTKPEVQARAAALYEKIEALVREEIEHDTIPVPALDEDEPARGDFEIEVNPKGGR